jgi:hypothetical protein
MIYLKCTERLCLKFIMKIYKVFVFNKIQNLCVMVQLMHLFVIKH